MSSAYGDGRSADTDFRRKWDRQEYAERARQREARDRLKEINEDRKRRGLAPIRKKEEDDELEQPKELLKMREGKIKLDANLGKTQVVHAGAAGEASKQPGFYCKACDIVVKDSANYLDHLNGRRHQQKVGVILKHERVSVDSVKDRLAALKRKKERAEQEKDYDLDSRVEELRREEEERKRQKKERKRQKKEAKKKKEEESSGVPDEIAAVMGFSGFNSSKQE